MVIRPKIKVLLLVLAICITFSVIFGEILISFNIGHECSESHVNAMTECHVCLKIEITRNLLRILILAGFGFAITALLRIYNQNILKYSQLNYFSFSPIILKVRINS